jgi:cyanophycinase-like exopeptidase
MTGLGGVALEGGGTDVSAAFQWMISHMGGKGDFLVLTAVQNTGYNSYVYNLGGVNSVATLEIPSRTGAMVPAVEKIIASADAVFIAGGAQNDYINFWQGTLVQTAIDADIRQGVPIGGASAGADVIGQFVYSAENNSATSAEALANPFNSDMTFAENFVSSTTSTPPTLPILDNTIVDTHFITGDRTGRMVAFLADLANPASPDHYSANNQPFGIGINEQTALLIPTQTNASLGETAGVAKVVGNAKAKSPPQVEFFETPAWQSSFVDVAGSPLTYGSIQVDDVTPGGTFNLNNWAANWQSVQPYSVLSTISVNDGVLTT